MPKLELKVIALESVFLNSPEVHIFPGQVGRVGFPSYFLAINCFIMNRTAQDLVVQ